MTEKTILNVNHTAFLVMILTFRVPGRAECVQTPGYICKVRHVCELCVYSHEVSARKTSHSSKGPCQREWLAPVLAWSVAWRKHTYSVCQLSHSKTFKQDNDSTVGGDGGCRGGEVRAGTTSPMSYHKGFKLQSLSRDPPTPFLSEVST